MVLTLNQIVDRQRTLGLSHAQINTFFFGEPHEFDAQADNVYPALFSELQASVVDRVNHFTQYNFRLYFCDLVKVAEGTEENETEVISDMSSVMQDFLAMLMDVNFQDDWEITDINNFTSFTETLGDMVAGVVVDVGIRVPFLADRCQVPASDSDILTLDMPRTKIYNYTATGSEGASFSIPFLSGKAILAAWREFAYQRVLSTTPTEAGKVQVGTVDLGGGKGILSDTNIVLTDALLPDEKLDFLYYA